MREGFYLCMRVTFAQPTLPQFVIKEKFATQAFSK